MIRKKIYFQVLVAAGVMAFLVFSLLAQKQSQALLQTNKDWLKSYMQEVFSTNDEEKLKEIIERGIDENYIQYANGKVLKGRSDFLKHRLAQAKVLDENIPVQFTFDQMVAEDDKVFTIHRVEAHKKNGEVVRLKLHALFTIRNKKLMQVDEVSYLLQGENKDNELAHSTE